MADESRLIRSTYQANMGIALLVLHDKFDFTPDQLEDYIDRCNDLLNHYNDGRLTFNDIANTLKEETGIEIKK